MTLAHTFTKEQLAKMQQLLATREGQTMEQLAARIVDRGIYDLTYRTKRNREQWQQLKAFKQSLREQE